MNTTGPDHTIHIRPAVRRWRAKFAGHVIADSADALVLKEGASPEVIYFPREDVSMDYLSRTSHHAHCPRKGEAAHYTLLMDGQFAENAVWTYEQPYPAAHAIEGRLAFSPEKVELYEVDDAAVNPRHVGASEHVDEVVQHTDTGDGHAQRDHWGPNVETPGLEGGVR